MVNSEKSTKAALREYLTPQRAKILCGLSTDQLARMADAGKLTVSKPGGTHRRYLRAEIEALAKPVTR